MPARMKHPALSIPDAMKAIQALTAAAEQGGVPPRILGLVHLRASQINGYSSCGDCGSRRARASGETEERLFQSVGAWG